MARRKLIIIIGLISLALGSLLVWGFSRTSPKNLLLENPGLPESEWPRMIQIEKDESGYKIISNKFDGYEISVPSNWTTPESATNVEYGAAYNNMSLNIFVVANINEGKFIFPASARFEEIATPAGKAFRTANKILGEDTFQDGKMVNLPIEDSLSVGYIFPAEGRTYIVLCSAIGDNFNEMVSLCEKQILTFKILK